MRPRRVTACTCQQHTPDTTRRRWIPYSPRCTRTHSLRCSPRANSQRLRSWCTRSPPWRLLPLSTCPPGSRNTPNCQSRSCTCLLHTARRCCCRVPWSPRYTYMLRASSSRPARSTPEDTRHRWQHSLRLTPPSTCLPHNRCKPGCPLPLCTCPRRTWCSLRSRDCARYRENKRTGSTVSSMRRTPNVAPAGVYTATALPHNHVA